MKRIEDVQGTNVRGGYRFILLLAITGYVACFQWMYVNWLYPEFGYFGFDYNPPGTGFALLAWTLSLLPALWMPINLKRPSQVAYWILYIMVFIPSMFVPLYAGLSSAADVGVLMVTLFVGLAIVGSGYLFPVHHFKFTGVSVKVFWRAFGLLAAALVVWMMVVFRSQLHIVSFEDVYDLRFAASDLAEGSQVNYGYMLLTGAIDPFLMAYGLFYRRWSLFVVGALGQLLVYSAIGTKGSILSILFIPGFYLLLNMRRYPFAVKLTFCCLALISGMCLSCVMVDNDPGPIHSLVLFVLMMRTLSMGGLVSAQYFDFFQHNPFTYYSHIKGVSWIVSYPYKYGIGQEIGLAYAGTTDLNATAHFWATDGIGGLGLPGVLLMSVLCMLVFWVLDSSSRRHEPHLAALVITYAAYNVANISIFTSLLSGGLALLIVLFYVMPTQGSETSRASMSTQTLPLGLLSAHDR
jgi:hypothetical protein